MGKKTRGKWYPAELTERGVRMVAQVRHEHDSEWAAIRSVAAKLGCSSVGRVGDSSDNALAETIIGLSKSEVTRRNGPWRNVEEVELATCEWVDWFNHRRLLEPLGHLLPPAEFEAEFFR